MGGVEGDGLVDITTIQMPEICVTTALSHQIFITTLEGPLQILEVHVLGMISEVPRVLFLGVCLDFYYFLWRVLLPKFGFDLDRGSVVQALVEPSLVPP